MMNTIKTGRTGYEEQRRRNHEQALAAFISRKAEIDAMLERLKALSDDHFGYNPDSIDFSHVGTLSHYRDTLREITDMAFHEGEHAAD